VVAQEMTISREAFLRSLAVAVSGDAFEVRDTEIRHAARDRAWRIVLTPLADGALGPIRLARHRVEIFLAGYDDAARRAFVERFELYFRRAGG
jgi:hypothetical protein